MLDAVRTAWTAAVWHWALAAGQGSPDSMDLRRRKSAAASRMRENWMQKACTSRNKSCTLTSWCRMRLCRNTHTSRTARFCMCLSCKHAPSHMRLLGGLALHAWACMEACVTDPEHQRQPDKPPSMPTQQCSRSCSTHCAACDPQQNCVNRASERKEQRRTAACWQEAMQLEM